MFPTKILLAVDGSPGSARAARMAIELSNRLDSELHVVYVEPANIHNLPERMIHAPDSQEHLGKTFERFARERLDEEATKIREAGGEVVETHPKVGRPDAEIVSLAEELNAGLVVLGSRGLGRLRRAIMGSVSSSVVHHSHTSVLIVRGEGVEEKDRLPGTILVSIDGSREAAAAAQTAVEIANGTNSELHVLYVLDTGPYVPHLGPEVWEGWQAALARVEKDAGSWIREQAERIEAEGGPNARAHLAFGKPDQEIVKLGEKLDAGLIVTGSRGLGGVGRALMGSVSDSVVCHAHCPVLVVRREESQ